MGAAPQGSMTDILTAETAALVAMKRLQNRAKTVQHTQLETSEI
jgi:hypothetical protein